MKTIRLFAAVALTLACASVAWAGSVACASVTTNGVTRLYATLTNAWADACAAQRSSVDATVKLLKDATVDAPLETGYNGVLTLDVNDHVLAYAGETPNCIVQVGGGTLHVVDTAMTRTPRYFTCDEAGLWSLSDDETDLVVKGGLLTGGRNCAIYYAFNSGAVYSISNVNFVGNCSTFNGGALSVNSTSIAFEMTDCAFFGNVAANNGGAVAVGICTMSDCHVEANVATNRGGGVYVRDHGSLVRTRVVGNRAGTGGGVHLTRDPGGCFPTGVKILMADGSEKNIEQIVRGDVVSTFDHEGGTNSSAEVYYVYSGTGGQDVFTLSFASGATLDIADRHDLLLETTRKYVTVSCDNARSFVGKRFYNYATRGWDELVGAESAKDCEAHYSLYTRGHGNCVANGLLTVPDDQDGFVNVYELDEALKADAVRLAADIETYGLATPEDYPNVPLEDFNDGNLRFARIAIRKGLTTQAEILFWNEFDYGPIIAKKAASAPRLMKAAAKLTAAVPITAPSAPYLKIGEDVVVTGNVSTNGAVSNFYVDHDTHAVIDILPDATGVDIGVTLSTGAGVFGWTNTVNHATSFFADDPTYTVSYTADGELALRTGIRVGGDAWATVGTDGICTIIGTGAMWNHDEWTSGNPLSAYRGAIRAVEIADGVTSVGSQLFHKFYAITNISCSASVTAVGDYAFFRCHSLERMSFGNDEIAFGEQSYTLQAGIRIKDGMPDIYPIPSIAIAGYSQVLVGKRNLTDATWTDITTEVEKANYNFFKIELRK